MAVEADDFVEVLDVGAAGDLPESGHARLHAEAALVVAVVLVEFADGRRAGADEGHIALEDVPELRELVEARLADEAADLRDARVIFHLEHEAVHLILRKELLLALLRVLVHAAELVHAELAAIFADARLRENDRSRRVELDDRSKDDEDDAEDRKADDRANDVKRALHNRGDHALPRTVEDEGRAAIDAVLDLFRVERLVFLRPHDGGLALELLDLREIDVDADAHADHFADNRHDEGTLIFLDLDEDLVDRLALDALKQGLRRREKCDVAEVLDV